MTDVVRLAYSISEAIELLPWGRTRVYKFIKDGELVTRRKYGRRYVLHSDLMDLLTRDNDNDEPSIV
jgi:hypothetical protein